MNRAITGYAGRARYNDVITQLDAGALLTIQMIAHVFGHDVVYPLIFGDIERISIRLLRPPTSLALNPLRVTCPYCNTGWTWTDACLPLGADRFIECSECNGVFGPVGPR